MRYYGDLKVHAEAGSVATMGQFTDKVVVVTGGGSGIGKACALLFGKEQAWVAILDWNESAAKETAEQVNRLGGKGLPINTDVGNSDQVKKAVATTTQHFGRIDILFANAAVQVIKPIDTTSDEEWERLIAANLRGTFLCCRETIPIMRRQRSGCIVIASSGHAFQSYAGYAAYASTKGGQLAMMRALAIDCAGDGIRVNCVIPGATETELLRAHFNNKPEEKERLLSKIPLGRLATPEDIARSVRMLASDDAAYITGTALVVDGGLLAQG
jgi:NAD(P)-dependent dehydrogenase (short-subunit alcohol dehydrogenase family)